MPKAMTLKEKDLDTQEKREKYVVTVVGAGRMGLPTACLLAEVGFKVVCLDVNQYIVSQISKGTSPFYEPGLSRLMKKNIRQKRLTVTTNAKESVPNSDIVIFVVNTPIDEKKKSNYSPLEEACRNVGLNLKLGSLLIFQSTMGPSVMETLVKETLETASGLKAGTDFGLAFSPIRASAGRILRDMTSYARVVAAADKQSLSAAKAVLMTFTKGEMIEASNMKTAEAVKLFENIYRDVNIALANEFAEFCEKAGIDYIEAQQAANTQPHCHLLEPGIVSGHIPKDPYLLIEEAENLGIKLQVTASARRVNSEAVQRSLRLLRDVLRVCGRTVKRSRVALLGVSYRPNVKEAKDSLILELVKILQDKGVRVNVFDPYFTYSELIALGYPAERTFAKAIEGTDCIMIAVGHDRFKRLSLAKVKVLMRKPAAVIDLAHVVNPITAEKEGFIYRGLGRGVWTK